MRYSSKFLGSLLSARSETANQAFSRPPAREDATNAPCHRTLMKPDLFRVDGLHANGLVSYAFDGKVTTNKSLGEAARVRRDAHRA